MIKMPNMQDIEKHFTSETCKDILQRYLSSNNFQLLAHETYEDTIAITYSMDDVKHEVRFVMKSMLMLPEFRSNETFDDVDMAKTYYIKETQTIIVLEIGAGYGFRSSTTFDEPIINIEYIKLTLDALSKYHAKSLSYQEKQLNNSIELESSFNEYIQILNEILPDLNINLSLFLRTRDAYRKVLCHGWMSAYSVLYRHNNEQKPIECRLLKLDMQHFKPPVYDVLTFIYRVTDTEFRKRHLHELLQFYYKQLKNKLHMRDLDIDELLPLEADFEKSVNHLLPQIKLETTCYLMVNGLTSIEIMEGKTNPLLLKNAVLRSFSSNAIYDKSLKESILELKHTIAYPELTLEDCFLILQNKLGATDYELLEYELKPMKDVNGFFGDHRRLMIKVSQVNKECQELYFFVKFTPKGSAQMSMAEDFGSFYKESFFYRHFVPMARAHGIKIIDDCTVPCYLTRQNDVMVFEDFGVRNYATLENKSFSYDAVRVVVKQLANLHATSMILEEQMSKERGIKYSFKNHYPDVLQESFFTKIENHQGAQSMAISIEAIGHQIGLFPDLSSIMLTETFQEKIRKAYEAVYELVKPSEKFRNAICHGDLWISNILVQQNNNKPIDCRFVDFQIMRYCPPAHDLLGFIYLTTNRSFRKQHLTHFIDMYYDELSKAFETCGYDIQEIYDREHFWKSVEYMTPQIVCQTVIYYHICVTNPELMKDYMGDEETIKKIFLIDRRDFIEEMAEKDPVYKERIKETLEDLKEMCEKYF